MRKLTTKQQFALAFSLYVFLLLMVLSGLFLVIFHLAVDYQLRQHLASEATEIINTHLLLDNNAIVFVRDETGSSLREYLLQNETTAVFLDNKKNILRSYGLFALKDIDTEDDDFRLLKLSEPVFQGKEMFETGIKWRGQQLSILVVPIKNERDLLGVIILGKSLGEINTLSQIMVAVLVSLGFLNLLGSFVLGYFLAKKSLAPIRKIVHVVNQIDLDRLDKSVEVTGHPEDEFVILAGRFNEMIIRLKENALHQKEFIANASHELKTPLTRAISSLDVIKSNKLFDKNTKDEIETIKQDLFSINTLLEKLLLLSKLKRDSHLLVSKERLDLNEVVTKLKRRYQLQLEEKKIILVGDYPKTIEVSIPKEYLEIILSNLLSNAIKYSFPNSEINLLIKSLNGQTTIEIKDRGIGIIKKDVIHIFDRFFRARNREKGYGIGLALVKHLCELYGINIQVRSDTNIGTSVKLTFPQISNSEHV